jgi:N-acetylglucosamine-6-phosphate deacetylase
VARAIVDGTTLPGDVEVDGERLERVGVPPPGRRGTATAGFVDLQVNGYAGVDFLHADGAGYAAAGRALVAAGVTTHQPTFITAAPEVHRRAVEVVAGLPPDATAPRIAGIHLEGPFLASERRGAHNPELLRPPDLELAADLIDRGPVTYVTLAPELPGGLDLVRLLVGRGIVVALGHSNAEAACAHAGFDAGATTVTHLFNAMPPMDHRAPGLAGVALARDDVIVQVICDGVHVADDAVRLAFAAARGRFALVTDAISATGLSDGTYALGDREVVVAGNESRLADGTLAGSVLTMDQAVRNLIELGVRIEDAVAAASAVPARVLRRSDLGRLTPGAPADIVVLDNGLKPLRTLIGGTEAFCSPG